MRYNENSHSSPSQAICGGFVCTGIRCREQLDTGHSAQRGKNLKGLAAVESISVLEAARQLGRSKNTVKYWVRKLPPETVSKDEKGRLWISSAGLELLREQLKAAPDEPDEHNHQEPDERTTHFSGEPPRTGRKTTHNHPENHRSGAARRTPGAARPPAGRSERSTAGGSSRHRRTGRRAAQSRRCGTAGAGAGADRHRPDRSTTDSAAASGRPDSGIDGSASPARWNHTGTACNAGR